VFGPVGTLQNVAVISSMQKTPVGGATVGVDWTAGPPNCCTFDDVASCAAAGDATKSSAGGFNMSQRRFPPPWSVEEHPKRNLI
jgi:hypothetical protein